MSQTREGRASKEWTLMFYFASDNPLAPGIVSQLKAIKQAGFHPEANVVVHFDPNEENTPVHIFDVNLVNKLRAGGRERIGFPFSPPSVRSLAEDKLWGRGKKKVIREALREELGDASTAYDPPLTHAKMSGEQNPKDGLRTFLDFCRKHYPARRYMLFILGHGLVTGHNLFLYDEHADIHSLSLKDLGAILRGFRRGLERQGAEFELVSFHCCSMSGLEVAYELQGAANYMLATQGPSFVGNWPYAPILVSIFNSIKKLAAGRDGAGVVKALVKDIWSHCYLNSYDFQLVGYSFDLCLCDLNKVREIKTPLRDLSLELAEGLADPLAKERILLAHWDAQSFWEDSYTDLYDFCFRLRERCVDVEACAGESGARLRSIRERCEALMRVLASGDEQFVIRSAFTGPAYQFAHGLFVYFPWAEPGNTYFWLEEYGNYRFKETGWREFLQRYFQDTMRQARGTERHSSEGFESRFGLDEVLLEHIPSRDFNRDAQQLGRGGFMSARQRSPKRKNFPRGGSGSSSVNNHTPSTRGPVGERGAQQQGSKKNAPGVAARTGVRAGDSGKDSPGLGDGRGSSSLKNYPSSTGAHAVAADAKKQKSKKDAPGVVARTGIRAGEKASPSLNDGSGASSVKNYPSNARASVGGSSAKQESGKKNAPGLNTRTGVRAGDSRGGKITPSDSTGDDRGSSPIKNYPPSTSAPVSGNGAKRETGKKNSPGVTARTGIRAGDPQKISPPDAGGDGPGTSNLKNYPRSAKRETGKKSAPGIAARTGIKAGDPNGGKVSPPDSTGNGPSTSSVKNYPSNARGSAGGRGAKQPGYKRSAPGIAARTGIKAGGKSDPNDRQGDDRGSSPVKNYPPSTSGPVVGRGAEQERAQKGARGVAARTGIRAGEPPHKTSGASGDGSGLSSVKNYPTSARASVVKKSAKQEGSKKNARGVTARTGIRAGNKSDPRDKTGDGSAASPVKNYPPVARGRKKRS